VANAPTGFVDLQVNGFLGVSFTASDLAEEDAARACREFLARGTAAFLPTIVTSPEEVYRRNLPLLAKVLARSEFAGRLLGIHVEGPFLSGKRGAVGAHNPAWVRAPDPGLLERMQEWAQGRVRFLTIAADQPGAEELARRAVKLGIAVSLGHHLAKCEDLARLADAGATALTHLGNGVPNEVHRHVNPIWAGLAEDRLTALLISDGHHLPREVLKVMIRAKGVARIGITSDAAPIAGMPPGKYHTLDQEIVLEPSGLLHNPTKGFLVGSSATMFQCMNVLAGLRLFTVDELWTMGFANPLRLIGVAASAVAPARPPVEYDDASAQFRLRT
jgi:N-acetylglucosamine-6-phosphate deacetylase